MCFQLILDLISAAAKRGGGVGGGADLRAAIRMNARMEKQTKFPESDPSPRREESSRAFWLRSQSQRLSARGALGGAGDDSDDSSPQILAGVMTPPPTTHPRGISAEAADATGRRSLGGGLLLMTPPPLRLSRVRSHL